MKSEINYNNKTYEVEFLSARRMKYYPGIGKSFPVITQCVIKEKSGLYVTCGEAVQNGKDKHNEKFGRRAALKYALAEIQDRKFRTKLWTNLNII